jgi:F420-non-reducing hydrogenase iron-sulfur subunit
LLAHTDEQILAQGRTGNNFYSAQNNNGHKSNDGHNGAFEPEITVFTCNYCGYMSADSAGALRVQYPPNIRLVRLPCTGKTDVNYIMKAFEAGADGVYVVGCSLGNCHHVRGNERGQARVERVKKLMDEIGLGSERLEMFFVSGSMGATFARHAQEMTKRIRALGPNPLKKEPHLDLEPSPRLWNITGE